MALAAIVVATQHEEKVVKKAKISQDSKPEPTPLQAALTPLFLGICEALNKNPGSEEAAESISEHWVIETFCIHTYKDIKKTICELITAADPAPVEKTQKSIRRVLYHLYMAALFNSSYRAALTTLDEDLPTLKRFTHDHISALVKNARDVAARIELLASPSLQTINSSIADLVKSSKSLAYLSSIRWYSDPIHSDRLIDLADAQDHMRSKERHPDVVNDFPGILEELEKSAPLLETTQALSKQLFTLQKTLETARAKLLPVRPSHIYDSIDKQFLIPFAQPLWDAASTLLRNMIWKSLEEPDGDEKLAKVAGQLKINAKSDLKNGPTANFIVSYLDEEEFQNMDIVAEFPKRLLIGSDKDALSNLENVLKSLSADLNKAKQNLSQPVVLQSIKDTMTANCVKLLAEQASKNKIETLKDLQKFLK